MRSSMPIFLAVFLTFTPPTFAANFFSYVCLPQEGQDYTDAIHITGDGVFEGDVGQPYKQCGSESEFNCFEWYYLTIAIPRTGIEPGSKWNYGDIAFEYTTATVFAPIGEWIPVAVIEARYRKLVTVFYFSGVRGVVAYKTLLQDAPILSTICLLHGQKGIGAGWTDDKALGLENLKKPD